jgi:uncharacterized protein YkwD
MPDQDQGRGGRIHEGRGARSALAAAATVLAVLPVSAAVADEPVSEALDTPGTVVTEVAPVTPPGAELAAPAVPVPPPIASISSACRGAHRRARPRRQQAAIRCLVNHARTGSGLRAFRASDALARAARRQARDMARRRYFAHQRPGGRSLKGRARHAGWRGSASLGEAIAYGCGSSATPVSIVQSWLASPTHRAILLSGGFSRLGVGVAGRAPVSCGGATYVLDAGRR